MKTVCVSCVGKLKEKFFSEAAAEYAKRLSRFCKLDICELDDKAGEGEIKKESDEILSSLKENEYVVLTDLKGESVSSEELSTLLDKAYSSGKSTVRFIIGGSCGVDDRVRKRADKVISFGRATYPHQLMRVILLEQIYRAFTISAGMPYHK